jgi:hypothetical protein
MNQDDTEKRLCAIFNIEGIKNKSQVTIKHTQNISLAKHEYVPDTLIDKYDIMKNMTGTIYVCNITDTFLLGHKKLPMLYLSAIYEKPLRNILLFRVYLCFTIQSEIKSAKDFINTPISGKFSLEIAMDGKRTEIDNKIDNYYGDEKILQKLKDFVSADEMKALMTDLMNEVDERFAKQYEEEVEYFKVPDRILKMKNVSYDDDEK